MVSIVTFRKVHGDDDILLVSRLAHETWREHYASILSKDQIEYMLDTLQSPGPIRQQMSDGYEYYIIRRSGVPCGYMSIVLNDPAPEMFLSKLYLEKSARGHGVGRKAMNYLDDIARKANQVSMYLTVNKHNPTIAVYRKMGFETEKELVTDIGGGYVMDDYVMRRKIPAA